MQRKRTSPQLVAALVGSLVIGVATLSIVVTVLALRRPPIVIVPGVTENRIQVPDEIPDAAAYKFTLLYLSYFDNYTPANIQEHTDYMARFIAPKLLAKGRISIQKRTDRVIRDQESSVIELPTPTLPSASGVSSLPGGILRITVLARRRIYISSEHKLTERVRYRVDLRPILPDDGDTYGFEIVGQSINVVPDEEPSAKEAR